MCGGEGAAVMETPDVTLTPSPKYLLDDEPEIFVQLPLPPQPPFTIE